MNKAAECRVPHVPVLHVGRVAHLSRLAKRGDFLFSAKSLRLSVSALYSSLIWRRFHSYRFPQFSRKETPPANTVFASRWF